MSHPLRRLEQMEGRSSTRTALCLALCAIVSGAVLAAAPSARALTPGAVKLQTSVTLKAMPTTTGPNGSVEVTAHLTDYTTTVSTHLDIYATPYGGKQTLLRGGHVNASGDLWVRLRPQGLTHLVAEFPGDALYDPASSPTVRIRVYPILDGCNCHPRGLTGYHDFYPWKSLYHFYHYSPACPGQHRGCPRFVVTLRPNHGGQKVIQLQVQVNKPGTKWHNVRVEMIRLDQQSKRVVILYYRDRKVMTIQLRVRVKFVGDADHLAVRTHWQYYKVTP
jgi:hypothetical protein